MSSDIGDQDGSRWFQETNRSRDWEDFYRNRWEHDDTARSTHGVNCSGACSWEIYSKNDIISWELQQTDYKQIRDDTPNYEPRGCQRGISTSWYPYSPVRPKHPYVRGKLLDFYRAEKAKGKDPVEAYESIVEDPERSEAYKKMRGKGGWRRVDWEEATELVAAAQIHTIKEYGPDRMASFSPIPAMSMVSWISGERLSGLLGSSILSFYEYYHDLPHIEPMIWGDQTDVAESADWYQSDYWIVVGTNLPMTRTADAHFASEFKYDGGKMVNMSPDYSDVTKFADTWVPVEPGTDAAFLLSCIHVILQEFYVEQETEYFREYVKQYTNLPFLVELDEAAEGYNPGKLVRAEEFDEYDGVENADAKPIMMDDEDGVVLPKGTMGARWDDEDEWNLKLEDAETGEEYDPRLTFLDDGDAVEVNIPDFTDTFEVEVGETEGKGEDAVVHRREVPARKIQTADGEKLVTTAFDVLMAQMGVSRGLDGDYPESYDDASKPFTPAWQAEETGVDPELATRVAREWAVTAMKTEGRCMFITGSGVLHWFHGGSLTHRAEAIMGILTGCMGRNGGGFNSYVGTEKVRPYAAVPFLGSASDWYDEPRLMNNTSYMYFHTDQHRYDGMSLDPLYSPEADSMPDRDHAADMNALAVRNGWLPFYPQFDKRNSIDVAREAMEAGAETDEEIKEYVRDELVDGDLDFALHDVDAEENHPKVMWVWRGNLVGTSTRGHEYMLKHLLGTHDNVLGDETTDAIDEVDVEGDAPTGKLDLLVNMNFRMDSSANYSDVVLPAAHWYEKYDLACTDLHSFFHPFTPAQDPPWETRDDWDGFKLVAKKFSELAEKHLPEPVKDVVVKPLETDTEDEIANMEGGMFDWKNGDVEPVPGKTMPKIEVVERDYTEVYDRYTTLGPEGCKPEGYGAKGVDCDITPVYEDLKDNHLVGTKDGRPSLERGEKVAETILRLSPETDGEMSRRLFEKLEEQTDLDLSELYEGQENVSYDYEELEAQPRRTLTSPHWTGLEEFEDGEGRTYAPWTMNVENLKPWHTLTGRQEVYFDHEAYKDLGEFMPTYKPPVDTASIGDVDLTETDSSDDVEVFRFLTPHGKWQIHSNFRDTWQMTNLSRGGPVVWMNDEDAAELGIEDNDWTEIYTKNGVQVCRAVVTHTMPRGSVTVYHQVERHVNVPFSKKAMEEDATDLRGGTNNSPTRIMQNPATMVGGYANWTYFINYWGTSPSERDMSVAVRKMPLEEGESPIYQEEHLEGGER